MNDSAGATGDATYGDAFADVYDEWYADVTNVPSTVDTLARLSGGGDLLELGVGTGRIAVPLARRLSGRARVHGVDSSGAMLDVWRAKLDREPVAAARSVVIHGDMAGRVSGGPFAVIFCTFNTFFNLPSHEAQITCLRNSAAALAPGGAVVLELAVFHETDDMTIRSTTETIRRRDGSVVTSTGSIDPASKTAQGVFTDPSGRRRSWSIRYATFAMVMEMSAAAGLVCTDHWEDFTRRPFLASSARQVLVLRRRLGVK